MYLLLKMMMTSNCHVSELGGVSLQISSNIGLFQAQETSCFWTQLMDSWIVGSMVCVTHHSTHDIAYICTYLYVYMIYHIHFSKKFPTGVSLNGPRTNLSILILDRNLLNRVRWDSVPFNCWWNIAEFFSNGWNRTHWEFKHIICVQRVGFILIGNLNFRSWISTENNKTPHHSQND